MRGSALWYTIYQLTCGPKVLSRRTRGPLSHPAKGRVVSEELVPGVLVRHPAQPDWGIGQVQSVDGHRVTVNFEHVGKQLINAEVISLEVVNREDV